MLKTCWIADVKARHGLTNRTAPNRKGSEREFPCPSDRVKHIEDALRSSGLLS